MAVVNSEEEEDEEDAAPVFGAVFGEATILSMNFRRDGANFGEVTGVDVEASAAELGVPGVARVRMGEPIAVTGAVAVACWASVNITCRSLFEGNAASSCPSEKVAATVPDVVPDVAPVSGSREENWYTVGATSTETPGAREITEDLVPGETDKR